MSDDPCPDPAAPIQPDDAPLRVIHADAAILVVDKPAGLLSVPGRGEDKADCLIARLRARYPSVLLVHRLDRDTSGVMVFALTPQAQAHLGRQFEARTVDKRYVALVAGAPEGGKGRVDLPLVVDWPNRPRQKVCLQTGRPAVTDWRMLKAEGDRTRMQLKPRTGRTHQLRVHMAALGHPILGDTLYADGPWRDHPRLMLHAERLGLAHPETGARLDFRVPAPF
jgi:tRNA pseudouridine32 synthase / 23S rRNA pseudouridine746 synthase